ncbi:MAG: TonB-dependent receptor [Chitinophagaceae bacterium]
MRKILIMLTVALSTLTLTSQAQTKTGKIIGTVIDGNTKTIESATITLLKAADSTVVKISVADKSGKYIFDGVPEGKYLVSISAVGHIKGFSELIEINSMNNSVNLKTIELIPQAKSLDAVVITTKKPLIEQKVDRMIVNVDATVTNVGSTALEVLEKSPGVSVDKDGNISLKGKQGVQIYIDGRPTYLAGADLANYLTNLSSSQLDQIEIMTNPPAKYEASGNSGIINIKTKKTKQIGYSGSISSTYSQSRYARSNESFNFNYRKNKLNFFTTLGHNYRKSFNDIDIQRKFIESTTKDVTSHYDQETRLININKSYNAKLGMDYSISKKTTLGVVFTGSLSPGIFNSNSDVLIADANKVPLSRTLAHSANEDDWKNITTNLNFRHVFDTTGKELTADIDYLSYKKSNSTSLVNAYFNPAGMPTDKADTLYGNLPQDINIRTAKVDYLHPLKNGAKFEAGLKTSFVTTDNDAVYDSLNYGVRVRDVNRSNHFMYDENVNAAYVNYSRPLSKKIFGQFGLRVENTNAKGNQLTTGEKFKRNYTQIFPTAYFQYKSNDKNSFGLNYGRRINRPDYEDLNPFIEFLDRYTYEKGNPNLKPQFSHNVELSHTYKDFLTTTLNFTQTTDIINQVLEQFPDKNETAVKKENIAKQQQYGIAVNAGGELKKWWSANLYANVYNNKFEGIINGEFETISATTGQFNLSNQFKLGKTWGAELSGFYRTAGIDGVFKIGGFGMMNVGLSKQVLKGNGSLRFSVRDLLYSQKVEGTIKYGNIDASFQQVRDSRVFSLNFSYRFNKGKVNSQKRKTGGADDEQNRINTGGN